MRIRFLLAVGATIALAGCGESSTAPSTMRPVVRSADIIECRSGYWIATRDDGTQYCTDGSEGQGVMATPPDSTGL